MSLYIGLLRLHQRFWYGYYGQLQRHLPAKPQLPQQLWWNQHYLLHHQQMLWWHLLSSLGFWDLYNRWSLWYHWSCGDRRIRLYWHNDSYHKFRPEHSNIVWGSDRTTQLVVVLFSCWNINSNLGFVCFSLRGCGHRIIWHGYLSASLQWH